MCSTRLLWVPTHRLNEVCVVGEIFSTPWHIWILLYIYEVRWIESRHWIATGSPTDENHSLTFFTLFLLTEDRTHNTPIEFDHSLQLSLLISLFFMLNSSLFPCISHSVMFHIPTHNRCNTSPSLITCTISPLVTNTPLQTTTSQISTRRTQPVPQHIHPSHTPYILHQISKHLSPSNCLIPLPNNNKCTPPLPLHFPALHFHFNIHHCNSLAPHLHFSMTTQLHLSLTSNAHSSTTLICYLKTSLNYSSLTYIHNRHTPKCRQPPTLHTFCTSISRNLLANQKDNVTDRKIWNKQQKLIKGKMERSVMNV